MVWDVVAMRGHDVVAPLCCAEYCTVVWGHGCRKAGMCENDAFGSERTRESGIG